MRRLVLASIVLLVSCGGAPVRSARPLAHAHRIDDEATWRALAARPEGQVVARTEVVKFLIDLADGRRLWFVDTERWPIHYDFARERLSPVEDHFAFNVREYRREDRRFVLGSLVHYLDSDLWTMELVAGDTLRGERVLRAFEQLRRAVFFSSRLRYRPLSPLHERLIAPVADRIPIVRAGEVFRGIRYQPLTQGTAYGTLRFVEGALDPASVRPDQILVLAELPDRIPVPSGVITAPLQAPLGHLAILCANRRTPNMALRGALSDRRLRALDGRLVRLEVGPQDFTIAEADLAEAERAWAARRPAMPLVPQLDARSEEIRDVCTLRIGDARSVGAKAAQLGEVCSIGPPIRTPGGVAVPFAHYLHHLERAGLTRRIEAMLADPAFRERAAVRAERLAALREAIEGAEVDPALVRELRARLAGYPGRVILRSSTNAEDLPGFTGAGLYESVVVPARASEAELASAIAHVWSSVWLQAAYEEREWYRVDHARVAMGVLAQPFVDGAAVNGVAITANPFLEARPAHFINAQALGGSVTGAEGDEIPEQYLVYTYSEAPEPELLSRSSRTGGRPLLQESDLAALSDVLGLIHDHFAGYWGPRANAADVEFLVAGPDRRIVILQARPYFVVYGDGQL